MSANMLKSTPVRDEARRLVSHGKSVVPIRSDGSKAPACVWQHWQKRLPTDEELTRSHSNGYGLAVICGAVSGNLEVLDFDDLDTYRHWRELVECVAPGLVDRLVEVKTPDHGVHIHYRHLGQTEGSQKLAQVDSDGEVKLLVETRGEGACAIIPPSPPTCHPANRPYTLVCGDIADPPLLTSDERTILLDAARSFNRYRPKHVSGPLHVAAEGGALRPGDDYNARGSLDTLLQKHGWTLSHTRGEVGYWTRPGKQRGVSATTGHVPGSLYVFTSNAAPFEPNTAYSPFAAYTLLESNGDYSTAARSLAAQGFGAERSQRGGPRSTSSNAAGSQEQADEEAFPYTDLGNAQRFAQRHQQTVRYCYAWARWVTWDERRWCIDDNGEIVRRGKQTVRNITSEAPPSREDGLKEQLRHALRSQNESRIRAMLELAKSEPGIPIAADAFDRDPCLLNCANGTIDLRTGKLREHRREDLITKLVPTDYDEEALCPNFEAFLSAIFSNNMELIAFIKRAIGYCLTGDTREEVMFILHGLGANGKSTLIAILHDLLGEDFAMQVAAGTLMAKRGETIPNDIARLRGARLVTAVETDEGRRLSEALVKQATGGDKIAARFMRAEWFDYRPTFKLWLATNHKPEIRGTDHAIWRRIRLIPFNTTFTAPEDARQGDLVQDKDLPDKLRRELPGILRWAVQGCVEWLQKGLGIPEEVREATATYRAHQDVLGAWLDDCCVKQPHTQASATDLYGSYAAWCAANGERAESQKAFGQRLAERGYVPGRSHSGRYWSGVGLKASSQ